MMNFATPIDEALFRQKAYFSLQVFIEGVFDIKFAPFHVDMTNYLFSGQIVYLILPRGFGKTTNVSVGYVLWRLWREKKCKIAMFSASREQTESNLKQVHDIIMNNPFFKNLRPEGTDMKWNTRQLETVTGNMAFVKPLKPTSRGVRPNFTICDDILRDEKYTQDQVKDLFWNVIFPASDMGRGQIVLVGTPMTTDDLLNDLQYPSKEIKEVLKKARLTPVGGRWQAAITDKNGKWIAPLWKDHPQFGSLDNLKATRALMGGLRFDREYMCNPLAGGSSIFTENLLENRHVEIQNKPRDGWIYYMGGDIALADQSKADFSVYTIIGVNPEGTQYIVKLERYQGMKTERQIERIVKLHKIFNFRQIVIEENGLSKGLVRTLTEMQETKSVMKGFITTQANKELLIANIQSALSTGTLILLDNEILINELRSFSKVVRKDLMGRVLKETYEGVGNKDDCVMSLGMALEASYSKKSSYSFDVC
ncbi:MAG: hypothetical protein K0A90_00245 [Methanosarcinaceae archaeon]|nr:hypothetical protein [Methanosarcinaceae archaeon]